jgi:hypothetical protein
MAEIGRFGRNRIKPQIRVLCVLVQSFDMLHITYNLPSHSNHLLVFAAKLLRVRMCDPLGVKSTYKKGTPNAATKYKISFPRFNQHAHRVNIFTLDARVQSSNPAAQIPSKLRFNNGMSTSSCSV